MKVAVRTKYSVIMLFVLLVMAMQVFFVMQAKAAYRPATLSAEQQQKWHDVRSALLKTAKNAHVLNSEDWKVVSLITHGQGTTVVTLANNQAFADSKNPQDGAAWLRVTLKHRQVPVCQGVTSNITYEDVATSKFTNGSWSVSSYSNRLVKDEGAAMCK